MRIGIVGTGHIGATAAKLFAKAGHHVAVRNSRGPATLASLSSSIGPNAKVKVAKLNDEIGFASIDTGSLRDGGRRQQPGSPIYGRPMTVREAKKILG